ncbi:MAG: hypothetical protein GY854_07930 [Deltaproteobacteria bacterium]|nr:hypothetical protein [Deltaproteobacteria bacterium]
MMFRKIPCFTFLLAVTMLGSCQSSSKETPNKTKKDPTRCRVTNLGEAANLAKQVNIADDKMVHINGIADPRALVWRDQAGQTNYITRIMGTEQRLFYLKKIAADKKPGILSEFNGYLIRWDRLPKKRTAPIAAALAAQYKIEIKPESTYVIDGDGKPEGCP